MGHHIPLAALALFAHGRFGLRRTKGAADAAHFMDKVGNVMQFSLTETNQVIHALILAHLGKVAGVSKEERGGWQKRPFHPKPL